MPQRMNRKLPHLAVLDPEKKVWTLCSLLNMESPKVQKLSHWLSLLQSFPKMSWLSDGSVERKEPFKLKQTNSKECGKTSIGSCFNNSLKAEVCFVDFWVANSKKNGLTTLNFSIIAVPQTWVKFKDCQTMSNSQTQKLPSPDLVEHLNLDRSPGGNKKKATGI